MTALTTHACARFDQGNNRIYLVLSVVKNLTLIQQIESVDELRLSRPVFYIAMFVFKTMIGYTCFFVSLYACSQFLVRLGLCPLHERQCMSFKHVACLWFGEKSVYQNDTEKTRRLMSVPLLINKILNVLL